MTVIPQAELDQRTEFLAAMPRQLLGYVMVEVRAWKLLDGNPFGSSAALVITRYDDAQRGADGPYQTVVLTRYQNPDGGWDLGDIEHGHNTLDAARFVARERAEVERMYLLLCEWYRHCDNYADGAVAHSILGKVPTCNRCAAKHSMTLVPFGAQV